MKTRPGTFLLYTVLVFAVALAIRGFILWTTIPIELGPDELEYVALAQGLARDGRYVSSDKTQTIFQGGKPGEPTAYRSPVLPVFLAIHYKLFGDSQTWPRLTLILLSSMVCVFLAFFGKLIGHPAAGLVAAALWAVNPPAVVGPYSADRPVTESLSVFLLTGAFTLLALLYRQPRVRNVVLAGLLMGLAVLSRGYLLFILPLTAAFLWVYPPGKRWQTVVTFTLVAATVLASWVARNWVVMRKPVLSTQTDHFYLGNNPWARGSVNGDIFIQGYEAPQFKVLKDRYPHVMDMSEMERSEMWTREAIRTVMSNPKHVAWLFMRKTLIFWGPFQFWSYGWYRWHYLFSVVLCFAALALVMKWPDDSRKFVVLLLVPLTASYIAILMTYVVDRWRLVIEPFVFLLGAMAVVELVGNIDRHQESDVAYPQAD